eukprot:745790_1
MSHQLQDDDDILNYILLSNEIKYSTTFRNPLYRIFGEDIQFISKIQDGDDNRPNEVPGTIRVQALLISTNSKLYSIRGFKEACQEAMGGNDDFLQLMNCLQWMNIRQRNDYANSAILTFGSTENTVIIET